MGGAAVDNSPWWGGCCDYTVGESGIMASLRSAGPRATTPPGGWRASRSRSDVSVGVTVVGKCWGTSPSPLFPWVFRKVRPS